MPLEFGLWRVDDRPVRVATRTMPMESRLEELIEADPEILGRPLLLIGRQVQTDHGKYVDLLGMDSEGGLHVLELKRDRTPREVVAQVLDYGSWVQELANEQVREIYTRYARSRGLVEELDEAFALRFGGSPPEVLNSSHTLTVVASEIDAATERIVTYLASGYRVPVNVLFFRYFEDEGRSYLARTWLMDEAEAVAPVAGTKGRGKQEPWNGTDWYVSFGDEPGGRSWDDALQYGFVSAAWRGLVLPNAPFPALRGAGIHPHSQGGVRGCGHGLRRAQALPRRRTHRCRRESTDGRPFTQGSYRPHGGAAEETDREDRREWVVPVDWEQAVPREKALWRTGFFANQNTACKLRAHFTIDEVSRHFGIG